MLTKRTLIIMTLLVLIIGTLFMVRRYQETLVVPLRTTQDSLKTTSETTLEVTPKTTESDPDLIVETKYVAKINGQVVETPVKSRLDKTTAKVTTEIDVTPLVNQMTPKWEVGVGVGYHEDSVYIPVSVQRNYRANKAVAVEIHLDPQDHLRPNGIEVQHKWYW